MSSTAPRNMDRAYDRTKPDCSLRSRPELPPNVAATVLTRPSTPRLSKNTDSLVSHWPGRISTDSLSASPYRSLRAATVTRLPRGAVTGTSRLAYMAHAMPAPTTVTASEMSLTAVNTPPLRGAVPTTGRKKSISRFDSTRKPPAPSEPIASTTIGDVMTGGASCGCGASRGADPPEPPAASSQRRLPAKVMNMTLVM